MSWSLAWLADYASLFIFHVLADQSSSGDLSWIGYLLNGGPFAVVVFLVVTDRLTTPGERDRLRKELTAAHEREAKLNENIRNEVVPLMTRSLEATLRSTEVTQRAIEILSDVGRFPNEKG